MKLLRRTSAALVSANRNDRALAFAREAVALWPEEDVVGRADMLGDLATIEFQAGVSDGVESIEQALAILGDDPRHDVQRAGLLLSSARVHMLNGRQSLGTEVAARAHATAEPAAAAGDRFAAEILVQALLIAATCRTTAGDASGLALFEQARAQAGGFVRAMMRYYINYSNALMLVGRYEEAVAVAREGHDYGRTHVADLGPLVMIEANMIEAHIYAGRLREAEELGSPAPDGRAGAVLRLPARAPGVPRDLARAHRRRARPRSRPRAASSTCSAPTSSRPGSAWPTTSESWRSPAATHTRRCRTRGPRGRRPPAACSRCRSRRSRRVPSRCSASAARMPTSSRTARCWRPSPTGP